MEQVKNEMVKVGGVFTFTIINKNGDVVCHNKVTDEGLTLLNSVFFDGAVAPTLYVGLYSNAYAPSSTDVMATFLTSASEFTSYSEASRQVYNSVVSGVSVSNVAAKATFNITGSGTIRGLLLSTSNVKNGTGGVLFSAGLLPEAKTVSNGDTVVIKYDYVAASV